MTWALEAGELKVLYLTYDGLLDPLGQSQILPYVKGLADLGHQMTVLSFEKPERLRDVERVENLSQDLRHLGIEWLPKRYHKRPSAVATSWDISQAVLGGLFRVRNFDLIHLRSYVLGPAALVLNKLLGAPLLFDMRGLWVQERIDGEIWQPNSRLVAPSKNVERRLLRSARKVVTLTQASVTEVEQLGGIARDKISVIPTCVDLDTFRVEPNDETKEVVEFCYHGSLGTWYDSDLLAQVAFIVTSLGHRFTACVNDLEDPNVTRLRQAGADVVSLKFSEVPGFLKTMDASVFFIRPSPSKVASLPTKMGEALATGLPIFTGPGIGDVDQLLQNNSVGIVASGSNESDLRNGLQAMLNLLKDSKIRDRCRGVAEKHFSLAHGVTAYDSLYKKLVLEDT